MSGRPRKYKTSADLEEAINKYFRDAAYDENGVKKKNQGPLTITGLALHLGFESRQSIFDYMKNEEFAHAIKIAKLRIENYLENKLFGNNVTGVIFNLKNNFNWKDKTEVGVTPGEDADGNRLKWRVEIVEPEQKG